MYEKAAFVKRCIIPVTGFFEPYHYNNQSYPIHIKRKDADLIGLAGIYTVVENIVTYTILTKNASPLFGKIHNKKLRQPVIIPKDLEKDWLDTSLHQAEIEQLIATPYKDVEIDAYAVSKDLFNSRVDSNTASILKQDLSLRFSFI